VILVGLLHSQFVNSRKAQIALLLAVVAAASMWCYADFLLVPYQEAEAARNDRPRGNLSDLYPRWLGARELLLHGRDPYSAEVTREIQAGYYGRVLDPARRGDPRDQQAFAYPVYVTFLLAPTVRLPFPLVQNGFRWLLVALTAATVPLWLRVLGWRISWMAQVAWMLFVLGSYPAVQGIKLQQLTLLVCGLIAGCGAALASGYFVLAGILLAVATIKPQLAALVTAWLALWAVSDWRRRQRFAWSFMATMLLLFAGSEILLPGWLERFRSAVSSYWQYTGEGKTVLDVALGSAVGRVITLLMLATVTIFCRKWRREPAGSQGFSYAFCLVLALTLVVIPTYAPYNQLLLLPGLLGIVQVAAVLWRKRGLNRLFLVVAAATLLWPWVATLILDSLLLALPRTQLERVWWLPLYTSLGIPVAVLGLLLLVAQSASLPTGGAILEN
jgi:hypothetical protein